MAKKEKEKKEKKKKHWFWRFCKGCVVHTFRTVLFAIMFIFCLVAIVWILFLKLFNAQHVSEEITQYLQQRLNRPVVISSLNLKFLNTIELKGFSVLDTSVAHGEPFVSAESVTIRYKVLPLLDQQLVIDEVTLNRPRINVVRGQGGHYNVPDIQTAPKGSSVYTSELTGKNLTVRVEDWTVKDGILSYKDLTSNISHAVYGLNLHFERLRFDELSRFTAETVLRNKWGDSISDMEIKATGHVNLANFNWSNFALRSLRTQVYLFAKPVDLTLDLDNLRTPYFKLKAEVPAFTGKDLSLFRPEMIDFTLPKSTLSAQGVLASGYSLLKLTDVKIQADDVKLTAAGVVDFSKESAEADLNISSNLVELANKDRNYAPIGRYKLSGLASASAHVTRKAGKLAIPLLDITLQKVSGDFYGFKTEGVNGEFSAKNGFSDLYAKSSTGKVTIDNSVFDKVKLSGTYRKGSVYAYISGADLNGVPMKLNLSIANIKSPKRKIRTSMYFKHFDPMAFIGTVNDFVQVIGRIHKSKSRPHQTGDLAWLRNFRDRLPYFMPNFAGNLYSDTFSSDVISGNRFNAEFDLTGMIAGMKKLDGTIEARLEDGVIHQMEKLAEEQQALNVTFQPFILMHRMERSGSFKVGQVLKDVPFNELAASVDFTDGLMTINNAYTKGPTISAAVSGWVNWVKENFDIIIWTMFNNTSRSGALAENLTDESGNPALAFKVSQSMLKPKLEMLRAKKTGAAIETARKKGLRTDFKTNQDFIKGDFHAKK